MTTLRLAIASLWHYRRSHLAVALGVAVSTAVMTGALLVGDSIRGSLRGLVLEGLGGVDQALIAPQPFRDSLAAELTQAKGFSDQFALATPGLVLPANVSFRVEGKNRHATDVTLLGVTGDFGRLNTNNPRIEQAWEIPEDTVWLTEPVATELGAQIEDEILVRLPSTNAIPADSPLGEKSDTTTGRRLKVSRILPAKGIARFSLSPSQVAPKNAFVSLATAQAAIDSPGKANMLLVGGQQTPDGDAWLAKHLRPRLIDYGLQVVSVLDDSAVQLESNQLVLSDSTVQAARQAWNHETNQPVVTYLANTLRLGNKQVPYSTVSGVDSTAQLGPLLDNAGRPIVLTEDEIAVNDWTADQLDAKIGDTVTVTYYLPESTHGELVEAAPLKLKIAAIVPLASPKGQPTRAADPRLTPVLEGVTDADSINDWDLPFDLVEPITQADEDYWDQHSTTPKAFISLALAKRLWQTRWGAISLLRSGETDSVNDAAEQLAAAIDPAEIGLAFQPIKRMGLNASSGTTPFDGLFFGFSMFLIASAVMLIVLLFQLGIDQRMREVGVLSATGWQPKQIQRQLLLEGLVVADIGAAFGVAAGVGYAWLMIAGLRTVWVAAVAAPFMRLHITWLSLVLGYLIGVCVAAIAIWWALRALSNTSTRTLLAGQASDNATIVNSAGWQRWISSLVLFGAAGIAAVGAMQHGQAQAGYFFGSGALVLAASLLRLRAWLSTKGKRQAMPRKFGLTTLAIRNVARTPSRSLLTIALVGAASFLILAISAFRLPPTQQGTGGYDLVATADQPLHYDLNTEEGRFEYGFNQDEQVLLDHWRIDSLRVYDGEDASCLNLYQTRQPRVLGLPGALHGGFAWAQKPFAGNLKMSPFAYLKQDLGKDDTGRPVVPVILDLNTALYSLKLYGGVGSQLTIHDSTQLPVTLEVVGLLSNSVLQGDLLISEDNFLKLFPETAGYRFFLCRKNSPQADAGEVAAMLEDQLSDYGFDARDAQLRLTGFLAVQNTYLSTFQTLGLLGLLLGVVGVAVVQLRNVAQRRGELALLQASGFRRSQVARLVLRENLILLLGGLAIGGLAATVALLPQTYASHQARLPWLATSLLLLLIAAVGAGVGWLATRNTLRSPLLGMLRNE